MTPQRWPFATWHALADFMRQHTRLFVLTGAGLSTPSGIPCYRDDTGAWQHPPPILGQQFRRDASVRRRYWWRSMHGWPRIAAATPNAAHDALATLVQSGHATVVTQNVDGLHARAGSAALELHGSLHAVVCLGCGGRTPRAVMQERLVTMNGARAAAVVPAPAAAPDGDAPASRDVPSGFVVPACKSCAGVLMPDVVFHGDGVPGERVAAARALLDAADAVLVVGSSLTVYSGYRFCEWAAAAGKPIAALNRGPTRADGLFRIKVEADCAAVLEAIVGPATAAAC